MYMILKEILESLNKEKKNLDYNKKGLEGKGYTNE